MTISEAETSSGYAKRSGDADPSTREAIDAAIEAFYADLAAVDLQPLWTQNKELIPLQPKPRTVAWLWRWKTMRSLAERAGELITIDRGGDRRVLGLANPGLGGRPFATNTLWGAIQYLGPRETAPAHRHSPGAIRFVLEGEGVWTTVDGDPVDMRPGDLCLTPAWNWHEHENGGDDTMIWFDALDIPLVLALDATFFENHPDELQSVSGPHNRAERLFRGRGTLPLDATPAANHSPLNVYRWADTDAALSCLLEARGGPLASLRFVDPTSGASVLPTFACEMHRVVPGGRSTPKRKTGSSIYVAYRGAGSTIIDGQRFEWTPGDTFVTPSWSVVEHEATEPSDLFAVSDSTTLRALGLYREAEAEPQDVTGTFAAK